ncbi:MAG: saccharopine dehydrogenase C-terminal domain-containing protein [Paracoccaceae bacterium]
MTIHWCGTGLSAIPGLRKLITNGHDIIVWNRTIEKAISAVGDITNSIKEFDIHKLENQLEKGDIVVSMLPGEWHVPLAKLCLKCQSHFVSSSYISPEMHELHNLALKTGLCLVNEVGLDPGIDHLMAHTLIENYRNSKDQDDENDVSFFSYCGGIPKVKNPFCYKFSWSPLGVLKALKSPSRSIKDFKEFDARRPWDAISTYTAPLPVPEEFEVYPNRDSLPFINQYHFNNNWRIKEFVRGTLRLKGWENAWSEIFSEIEKLSGENDDEQLTKMSDKLWLDNAYRKNEVDRVVLIVSLKASNGDKTKWHKTFALDAYGDSVSTAMARLVSLPVSFAVEAVAQNKIAPGVSAAPSEMSIVNDWLHKIKNLTQHLEIVSK